MRLFRAVNLFFLLLLLFTGCSLRNEMPVVTDTLEKTETCQGDPAHSYEVYVPKIRSGCSDVPLLIILDPHAEGAKALELFKVGADRHGMILAASNRIQNNYPDYISALNLLLEDIRGK